jgi:hypothetical protein
MALNSTGVLSPRRRDFASLLQKIHMPDTLSMRFRGIVEVGRNHLQDGIN